LVREELHRMKPILPRFTLGSLFLVVLVIATGLAWWLDHTRLKRDLVNTQTRLEASELLDDERVTPTFRDSGRGTGSGPMANRQPFATPSEFIAALRETRDYYEFQNRVVEFVNTPVADDAIPSLVKLLEQPDAEVRSRALLTMCYLSPHATTLVPVIVPLLDDQDENVRWHAANALGCFGPEARLALPSLLRIIEAETSQISAFVAGIAFRIDPTTDVESRLQYFLRKGDAVTRWRAVEALGNPATQSP
jgi:hypothetical protein